MKKILLLCALFFLTFKVANAHNPLSAMYYLEVKGDFGILNVGISQAGLHNALVKFYPDQDMEKLSTEDYKKLAFAYIKENFELNINDTDITILNGGIKLGNHQTDFKFITSKLPEAFNTMDLNIEAFKENGHHQTIFALLLNGVTSKVVLKENNAYSAKVEFNENNMIVKDESFNKNYLWFLLVFPVLILAKKASKLRKPNTEIQLSN